MKRQAEIKLNIDCEAKLMRFESHERLGELFEIDARIVAASKTDFLPHLGKPAMIELFELQKPVRFFHALIAEAHFVQEDDQGYHYDLKLRPWLYALTHNKAYRVFEDMTGLDIVKQVLTEHSRHVDYGKVSGRYQSRRYSTQYRESDFDFLSRIMEREGIYYYFEHQRDDHVLVLCDAPAAHVPVPGYVAVKLRSDMVGGNGGLTEALWRWHEHVRVSGERSILLQSFDYEATTVRRGAADGGVRNPADRQEVHEYRGDFVQPALADHWATVALEAARARQRVYSGEGDPIGLCCGARFRLDSADAFDRGNEFVVTALDMAVDAEPYRSGAEAAPRRVTLEAVKSDTQWRSPIVTPTPHAGPETAVVTAGGADDSNVDAMGRVRIRFLWGKPAEAPERSRSCWLRVSHPSAGASFGHVTLPRLEEEVIVDFLDGNPDRPIVTGRVYNSRHPHPYSLPENRTRSLYRSQTIGRGGAYPGAKSTPPAPGYNELMFDDRGGDEQVYLRAQRNRLTEVMLDDEHRVNRDRSSTVYRDDHTTVATGDSTLEVTRGSVTIEAATSITLRVGANTIVIDRKGITCSSGPSQISLAPAMIRAGALMMRLEPQMLMTETKLSYMKGEAIVLRGKPTLIMPQALGPFIPLPA
ncbi:type VI secretion system Vgr family protein [Sphingomonas sp. DT-51]|uniref:type VI secretion system Vgr family protein n=1 Tax=Sphingomonas sp. DT-51 TaxID=3396165 RepID=UPI003F1E01F2